MAVTEKERVQRGEEKRRKTNGGEREIYVLREERKKLDKIIMNFYHFLSVPFQRWNDTMSNVKIIWYFEHLVLEGFYCLVC